eukprot:scaffold61629_cov44-Attheya_sp.AAC.2
MVERVDRWHHTFAQRFNRPILRVLNEYQAMTMSSSSTEVSDALRRMAENDPCLLEIILDRIDAEEIKRLASTIITRNSTVITLDLKRLLYVRIGDYGATAIAMVLQTNRTIRSLRLDHNNIGPVGARALATTLHINSSIVEMSLTQNRIGDTGACAIAAALLKNSTLKHLSLGGNGIGDVGAVAFGLALEQNTTLECVSLRYNHFAEEGRDAILRAFQRSHQTASIIFPSNCSYTDRDESLFELINRSREINKKDLYHKITRREMPDSMFPQVVAYLSRNQQHVNKIFSILRERPELIVSLS